MQTSDEFTEPRGPRDTQPPPRNKAVAAVRSAGRSPSLILPPDNSLSTRPPYFSDGFSSSSVHCFSSVMIAAAAAAWCEIELCCARIAFERRLERVPFGVVRKKQPPNKYNKDIRNLNAYVNFFFYSRVLINSLFRPLTSVIKEAY